MASSVLPSNYQFDFYVLYADADLEFVEQFVEKIEEETEKRGHYKDGPNATLGSYNFDNLEKALEVCERTFIILSNHTNNNEEIYFEGLNALEKYLQENKKENRMRLVPVILQGGVLPNFLRVFSKIEQRSKYFWKNICDTVCTPIASTLALCSRVNDRSGAPSLAQGIQDAGVSSSTSPTREYYDGYESLR
ncbi:uncharacterized protein [Ptychodera flava]|uniref:uncharacterized protein isoform X2 n=1 Tax=Ptychodera flava TaxID=63121 RepID=UPI00396A3DD6